MPLLLVQKSVLSITLVSCDLFTFTVVDFIINIIIIVIIIIMHIAITCITIIIMITSKCLHNPPLHSPMICNQGIHMLSAGQASILAVE